MLKIWRKLFSKQPVYEPRIREEFWRTDFGKPKKRRWQEYEDTDQSLFFDNQGMHLIAKKPLVSVWQNQTPDYEYKDLIIEVALSLTPGESLEPRDNANNQSSDLLTAGTCAAGLSFRSTGSTYYTVLISDGGYVRMDAVFNNNPVPLLGWLELPSNVFDGGSAVLRIIARETEFLLMVNNIVVAQINDDTIQSTGAIACVLQNWGGCSTAAAVFSALLIDSRRAIIESLFDAYARKPAAPQMLLHTAESLFSVGRILPALSLVQKIIGARDSLTKNPESSDAEIFTNATVLASRMYESQHLYEEARQALEQLPDISAAARADTAIAERYAGVLYLLNDFPALATFIQTLPQPLLSASLENLAGHAAFETQNWVAATEHYSHAATLAPTEGLFSLNAAKAADKAVSAGLGNITQTDANKHYLAAATSFLNDERYEDLAAVVTLLLERDGDNPQVMSIAGKYYYAAEDMTAAEELFTRLVSSDNADASVYYLLGLIERSCGEKKHGTEYLATAVNLEPSYPLFRRRYAEALLLDGNATAAETEITETLNQCPTDGWALNLAASIADTLQKDFATSLIAQARSALPDEFDVLENYVHITVRAGLANMVLPLLDPNNRISGIAHATGTIADNAAALNPGRAYNLGGNILVGQGQTEAADEWYRAALEYEPNNSEFLVNRATLCLELNMFNEADSLLAKAHENEPSSDVYQLIGYLAARKGDFVRAEVSYRQGIQEFADSACLYYDLAQLYRDTARHAKAAEILEKLCAACPLEANSEQYKKLHDQILSYTHRTVLCSDCGHTWYIPNDIPLQVPLHLAAEPPDDMPAGTCIECGRSFCIGCAKKSMTDDGRFVCTSCGGRLKLADQGFIWLLRQWIEDNNIT